MPIEAKDDRLLFFTRLVLTLLLALMIFISLTTLLIIPILYLSQDSVIRSLAENGIDAAAIPWIAVSLALVSAMAALGFFFFRHLRRIVDSVSDGDPFIPVNADRLKHMGWLALAIQALVIPATGLVIWFDALPQEPNVHYSDNNSLGGLVLAMLLFVLARVFRVGSAMREELEGTV
ncbi:MAG: DUF2975 domain-containing protein [Sphingomonas sp.]|nr:DUF2975 domain-containing protein [Sphingomonas sp.]